MSPTTQPMYRSMSAGSRTGEEEDDLPDDLEARKSRDRGASKSDVGGIGLFKSVDYYMLMFVAFCLTGTGKYSLTIGC